MENLTLESVTSMVKDETMISLAKSLFQAIAYVETVKAVIAPKQQEIIDRHQFKTAPIWDKFEGGRTITKESDMFLASDEDFQIYLDEMDSFHNEKGFQKISKDHCPLLMAESLLRDVQRGFVDSTKPYTGMDADMLLCSRNGLANYKTYIDLHLNLFAPTIKNLQA
jgi:hypothetical protein